MAEDDEETEALEDDSEDEEGEGQQRGKKMIILIALVVLLLGGAGAGVFFSGMLDSEAPAEGEVAEGEVPEGEAPIEADATGPTFYEMQEFLVNLNTGGRNTSFLKMTITLELPAESMVEKVQLLEPRIRDTFFTYLRELRASDLSGSAGLYRLREELLMRLNKIMHPNQVNDILFKEIIVQ